MGGNAVYRGLQPSPELTSFHYSQQRVERVLCGTSASRTSLPRLYHCNKRSTISDLEVCNTNKRKTCVACCRRCCINSRRDWIIRDVLESPAGRRGRACGCMATPTDNKQEGQDATNSKAAALLRCALLCMHTLTRTQEVSQAKEQRTTTSRATRNYSEEQS